ncbi:MAG: murein biosynthesis integral membrane protein MurJ [Atopobiaceae bacterium]|nr:murein biosynthesis integral membrane protein MurJ [Atopobiaceae bacterium]
MAEEHTGTTPEETDVQVHEEQVASVGRSAMLMSALVIVSRITGFVRTWAQAFALGATVLASCYAVANNLPTQIYEIVTAGMLVTAFLPVYMSVKKRLGIDAASDDVSTLTSIVLVITLAVTLLSIAFAAQIVWTQSFSAAEEFDASLAVWFFRFFAIEIVLYALSTIFSGVVNAERDYLWSSLAPIFYNLCTIASFLIYVALADTNPVLGLVVLGIGNPLGVFMQMALQIPSMYRHGVRLRFRIDLKDPALKDTLKIGVPSIVILITSFVTASIQVNAALGFTAVGAAVADYAHPWYTLPYAVLCVPIMTTLFTELSDEFAQGRIDAFCSTVSLGASQILFFLIPFALYLMVFSTPLISVFGTRFSSEAIALAAVYLMGRAPSLPVYGVGMYLQKVFSSTRKMELFAFANVLGSGLQVVLLLFVAPHIGLWFVPFTSFIFFAFFDAFMFLSLKRDYPQIALRPLAVGILRSFALGLAGSAVGWTILHFATPFFTAHFSIVISSVLLCVVAGIPSVIATYGLALALKVPEADVVSVLMNRLLKRG